MFFLQSETILFYKQFVDYTCHTYGVYYLNRKFQNITLIVTTSTDNRRYINITASNK